MKARTANGSAALDERTSSIGADAIRSPWGSGENAPPHFDARVDD